MPLTVNGQQEEKKPLVEAGVYVVTDVVTIHQGSQVVHNGQTLFLAMEQVGLSINPLRKKANGPKLFFNLMNLHGAKPSEDYIGDLQVISNIEAGNHFGLFEGYLEQSFGHHQIKAGLQDLNATFLFTEPALAFSNSSFGIMPSVSANVACSIFPLSSLGISYTYQQPHWNLKLAVFDGNPGSYESNRLNLNPVISHQEGALLISELEHDFKSNQNTYLKVGTYWHTSDFEGMKSTAVFYRNNYGAYFLFSQNLFHTNDMPPAMQFFLKGGIAPADRNMISSFIGAGCLFNTITHLFDSDQIGVAIGRVNLSKSYSEMNDNYESYETVLDLFYGIDFLGYFRIQPSVQYIINPGALSDHHNAFVSIVRAQITI